MENKAIIFGLELPGDHEFEESLLELENLATSCGYQTIEVMRQKSDKPTPSFYIGRGKVDELKARVDLLNADLVIFDQELSPVHYRNLEEALDIKILDRTMLILEIFESRAHSQVSKLQVSLARDQYMLPRIIGKYRELSRQRGATSTIGGPGEQKLELERRRLRDNIVRDRRALAKLVTQRRTQRQKRIDAGVFSVAIVGYTNAGKSTLLNRMVDESKRALAEEKKVYQEDKLFATLETASRLIVLPNNRKFVAIDTVGFVRHMPAHLIAAFRSTLEEITEADLIVHVLDGSSHEQQTHARIVMEAMYDIGVGDTPVIYVRNKMDLIGNPIVKLEMETLDLSAKTGSGVLRLLAHVSVEMDQYYQTVVLSVPYDEQAIVGALHEDGYVFHAYNGPETITVDAELPKRYLTKYAKYIVSSSDIGEMYHPS
ncbi:MAG TPA: GTPase HflX [Bacilli bacterium]|nr:GTPase HflX [Bacilli bacterium]